MKAKRISFAFSMIFLSISFLVFFPTAEALNRFTVMVPGHDGTLLATDVYLPNAEGRWPVLLSRTPYNKGNQDDAFAMQMAGLPFPFAVVIQDLRGRYGSEGEDTIFRDDALDGVATINWITQQSWYLPRDEILGVGGIGTYGGSALGITQNLLATQVPPDLICQVVAVAPSNFYTQASYQGNALRLSLNEGWLLSQSINDAIKANASGNPATATAPGKFFENRYKWYWHLPLKNFPIFNRLMPNWNQFISTPDYGPSWEPLNIEDFHDQINVPVYHIAGWYDIFLQGDINNFLGLQYNGAGNAYGKQKIVIGPWTHGNWFGTYDAEGKYIALEGEIAYPGYANFPSGISVPGSPIEAIGNYVTEHVRWFWYWLYGISTGINFEPPVHYFVMGANEWRWANEWPLSTTMYIPHFFRRDGSLSDNPPANANGPITYTYNPRNPVLTLGGQNLVIPSGPYDQNALGPRSDVITFESAQLTDLVEVTGPISVHLWVSSNRKDTDFTAKLIDVYPDGRAMLATDGIQRARYRMDGQTQALLTPGEIVELDIDLWSTSIVFQEGHKIRVDISSSNFPRFDRNPNTGRKFGHDAKMRKANNTIYLDVNHPSHIVLPIQPIP